MATTRTKRTNTLETLSKKELNAYITVKSVTSLQKMADSVEVGDFVTMDKLHSEAGDFLSSRSIGAYIGANRTIRKVTDKTFKRTTKKTTRKYVNVDDENDVIIRTSRQKGYEVK